MPAPPTATAPATPNSAIALVILLVILSSFSLPALERWRGGRPSFNRTLVLGPCTNRAAGSRFREINRALVPAAARGARHPSAIVRLEQGEGDGDRHRCRKQVDREEQEVESQPEDRGQQDGLQLRAPLTGQQRPDGGGDEQIAEPHRRGAEVQGLKTRQAG